MIKDEILREQVKLVQKDKTVQRTISYQEEIRWWKSDYIYNEAIPRN